MSETHVYLAIFVDVRCVAERARIPMHEDNIALANVDEEADAPLAPVPLC
jgi:hypothetical protein